MKKDNKYEILILTEKRKILTSQKNNLSERLSNIEDEIYNLKIVSEGFTYTNRTNPYTYEINSKLDEGVYVSNQITDTEKQINGINIKNKELDVILSNDYDWIKVISPPNDPRAPVGPNRIKIP